MWVAAIKTARTNPRPFGVKVNADVWEFEPIRALKDGSHHAKWRQIKVFKLKLGEIEWCYGFKEESETHRMALRNRGRQANITPLRVKYVTRL